MVLEGLAATAADGIICGMVRLVAPIVALLVVLAAPLSAQEQTPDAATPPPPEPSTAAPPDTPAAAPRTMPGSWEFSNADREKSCIVRFRNEPARVGKSVEFEPKCATLFSFVPDIVGWRLNDNDFLRLLDAQGQSVLEFSEVESGIFEAPKPGEGILFIQNPTDAGPAPKTADQIKGEWTIARRNGRAICALTLSDTAVGEEFAVRVQPGCDPVVVRFAPATWQIDRGEIVLRSSNGQAWRFEENEDAKWQRIPQTANPLLMIRK
jgi:Protease inhibitor Inh